MISELCSYVSVKKENFKNDKFDVYDENICPVIIKKANYDKQLSDNSSFMYEDGRISVSCELCPSVEGIMKPTNKGGLCHIVCALYVPGAIFLSPEKLSNISLESVTKDKFNKVCSICVSNNDLDNSTIGACIQCKTSKCDVYFHVTCALLHGFLGESDREFGGTLYLAFCPLHKHRAKRRRFTMPIINNNDKRDIVEEEYVSQLQKEGEENSSMQEISPQPGIVECSVNIENKDDNNEDNMDDLLSHGEEMVPHISKNSDVEENATETIKVNSAAIDCLPAPTIEIVQLTDCGSIEAPVTTSENVLPEATVSSDEHHVVSTNTEDNVDEVNKSEVMPLKPCKRKAAVASTKACNKKEKSAKKPKKSKEKSHTIKTTLKLVKVQKAKKDPKTDKKKASTRVKKKITGPNVPKSLFDHMKGICSPSPSASKHTTPVPTTLTESNPIKKSAFNGQTMEELLEWQWHETGSLLMEQADTNNDIASLLSSLHEIKHGNEQLLSKYLKLQRRRDHLRAINAKLQMQLLSKPPENVQQKLLIKSQEMPQSIMPGKPITNDRMTSHNQEPRLIINNVSGPSRATNTEMPATTYIWPQTVSKPVLPTFDQSLKTQARALFSRCQQKYPGNNGPNTQPLMTGPLVSNLLPQTDLGAYYNNKAIRPMISANDNRPGTMATYQARPTLNPGMYMSPNNGLDLLYHALNQTPSTTASYQPQTLNVQDLFYQTASKIPAQSGNRWNYNPTIAMNPDHSGK